MAGTGKGEGSNSITKLENSIAGIKYTLFFLNIVIWMLGCSIFAVSIWLRVEPEFEEWVTALELDKYYIGLYLLIFGGLGVMVVSFLGCAAALMENTLFLFVYIGTQAFGFIIGVIGSAVLLDYSTYDSRIQPLIRDRMRRLIMNAHHLKSQETLAMIQENIGCCGADGPNDYLILKQPFPSQCRDTTTGNAYFHGCVDELTWYMEAKSAWLCGIVMTMCFLSVLNFVLSIILIQALKKEEDGVTNLTYNQRKHYD